ncbi:MAG: MFS transporter [Candidatus Heimdallarchaeota archaeon]|nr:MAG: MFS transporter [Candidatus Heimdallarchaeota archaeon]
MTLDRDKRPHYKQFSRAQCQRNIQIFQITGFDITVLIVPVIVLVWLKAGLAFHEMLLLQGLFVLPILILEVPSGSIADFWSRKGCSSVFHGLFGIAMFFYAIGDNFYVFAIAEILAGIAVAFQTGSETALVYDSLLSLNDTEINTKFGNIVSKRMTIMFLGGALGALAGGFIGTISVQMPILIATIGHLTFAALVYWGYTEPPRLKAKTPQAAIMKALGSLKHQSELKMILIFSLTGIVFSRIGFWAVQHILVEEFLVTSLLMGFVLAGFNLCAAISSLLIRSRVDKLLGYWMFLLITFIEGAYILALIQIPNLFGILVMSLLAQITRGIRTPIIQAILQQYLRSDERATFVSLMSFVGSSIYFILSIIIDILDFSREQTLAVSLVGLSAITFLLLGFQMRKYRRVPEVPVITS